MTATDSMFIKRLNNLITFRDIIQVLWRKHT